MGLINNLDNNNMQHTFEAKLKNIISIILWGFIIAVVYHFFIQGFLLHKEYPHNTFLFLSQDRFNDFYNMLPICRKLNPYFETVHFFTSNYFPLLNVLFWMFSLFNKDFAFFLFLVCFVIVAWKLCSNFLINKFKNKIELHKTVFILLFLNYGFLFALDRGNSELYLFLFVGLFLYAYNNKKYHLAALYLAIASAFKLYPLLFILLFISEKKYKELAYTIFYFILFTCISLLLFKQGFELNLIHVLNGFELKNSQLSNLPLENNNYFIQGSSLFNAFKILLIKCRINIKDIYSTYINITIIITLIASIYIIFIEQKLWVKATIITLLVILLPHISGDYKLILLIPCILLYLIEDNVQSVSRINYKLISVLLGILIIPKSYIYFDKLISISSNKPDIPISNIINPLIMLYLIYILIKHGIKIQKINFKFFNTQIKAHLLALKADIKYVILIFCLMSLCGFYSFKVTKANNIYKDIVNEAEQATAVNETNKAISLYSKAYYLNPLRLHLLNKISELYAATNQLDSAFSVNQRLLKLQHNNQPALIQSLNINNAIASNYLNQKDFTKAVLYFNNVITNFTKIPFNENNKPFIINVHVNAAICKINLQKWKEADELFNKILALDSNNEFVKNNRAFLNQNLK